MWNRVVLLASGIAFGWTLVNVWTVASAEVRRHQGRLAVSLIAGWAMVLWLGWRDWRAGLYGAAVFTLSALVAYAGNAKQVGKVERILPPRSPERPLGARTPVLVLVVAPGEPPQYEGPLPWAARFREWMESGKPVPHWFVRPRTYARIRDAREAMRADPLMLALWQDLEHSVSQALPADCKARVVFRYALPSLIAALVDAPSQGYARLMVVALEQTSDIEGWLRKEVQRSGVQEVGVQVRYAAPPKPLWSQAMLDASFARLMEGQAATLPPADEPAYTALIERLQAHCVAWQ